MTRAVPGGPHPCSLAETESERRFALLPLPVWERSQGGETSSRLTVPDPFQE